MNDYIGDNIKVVLFDHDDTLVGTFSPKSKLHKLVARTYYGKELSDEEIIANWGKPLPELVGILYGTIDADKALENNAKHHTDFPKELFEPTIPVLRHIKSNGKKIGIITATSRFSFEHDLDLHNIPRELIDYTQAAEDSQFHKPDKRVFDPVLAWLGKEGVHPEEVIYIGDGLHDMEAALGAGFNFLGVETGLVTHEGFESVGATSIPDTSHLL